MNGAVCIYRTSMLVNSFEIDLLRDVTPSVQCLGLLEQKGEMPREPHPLLSFRIQNTLIPRFIQACTHCHLWSLQYKITPNRSQQILYHGDLLHKMMKFLKCNEMVVTLRNLL